MQFATPVALFRLTPKVAISLANLADLRIDDGDLVAICLTTRHVIPRPEQYPSPEVFLDALCRAINSGCGSLAEYETKLAARPVQAVVTDNAVLLSISPGQDVTDAARPLDTAPIPADAPGVPCDDQAAGASPAVPAAG